MPSKKWIATLAVLSSLAGATLSLQPHRMAHFFALPSKTSQAISARATAHSSSLPDLPLSFEPNQGQSKPEVRYLARGLSYNLFLTSSEVLLSLPRRKPIQQSLSANSAPAFVHLRLEGSRPISQIRALDPLIGKVNYFGAHISSQSQKNIPTFAKVEYENVYPGIDLAYHGTSRHLEYDFILAPGADPRDIRINFAGTNSVHLAANGNLVLETSAGNLIQHKPLVFQGSGSSRHEIAGSYRQLSSHIVAFSVGPYDKAQTLIIDPVLEYLAAFYPGTDGSVQFGNSIAVDSAGSAYITGLATNAGTVGGPDCYNINVCSDAFVDKLSPDGTALVYQTVLANSSANSIAVDASGNAYVAGAAQSPGFGAATNGFQQNPQTGNCPVEFESATEARCTDAFVAVFNPSGSALIYSTYLGGQSNDSANSLALDSNNDVFITGFAGGDDFPHTAGAFQTTFDAGQGLSAIFAAKIDATKSGSTSLLYSTFIGGVPGEVVNTAVGDEGNAIAVDSAGNAYIAGSTHSANMATAGAFQTKLPSTNTAFVAKLNPSGSELVWATYLGGSHFAACPAEYASGIAVDSAGNSYVTGLAGTFDFPITSGAYQTKLLSDSAAFVTKINSGGTQLVFSTFLGGDVSTNSCTQAGAAIGIDSSSDVFVAGVPTPTDFPSGLYSLSPGCYELNPISVPICGGFLSELDPTGSSLPFSTYLLGRGATGLALGPFGIAYVAGTGASVPITPPPGLDTGQGVFIDKIDLLAAGPAVLLSPKALAFPLSNGQTSSARATFLENLGNTDLNISSIAASSGFSVSSNHCGTQLGPGQSCAIGVTFASTNGPTEGTLTVTDDSFDSPHVVLLHGGNDAFAGTFSPTNINFPDQLVGTTSAPLPVEFKSVGSANLTILTVAVTGDFAQTNTCGKNGAMLPVATSCEIDITFTPTAIGTRRGGVTVTYEGSFVGSASTTTTVNFAGNGVAAPLSVTASSSSATVQAGQTANYSLQISSAANFNGLVTISCTGVPADATCSAPSPVTLKGSAPVTEKISVSTTAQSVLTPRNAPANKVLPPRVLRLAFPLLLALGGLFLVTRAQQKWRAVVLCVGALVVCSVLSSCGGGGGGGTGGGSAGTPSGTYALTVAVTGGGTAKDVSLTLNVE